jgi:hypothetical protein
MNRGARQHRVSVFVARPPVGTPVAKSRQSFSASLLSGLAFVHAHTANKAQSYFRQS